MLVETISLLAKPTIETIYMVITATLLSTVAGLPLGILLFLTNNKGLLSNKSCYFALSTLTNTARSIPYIILMIAIIPVTRLLTGSSIGTNAAIVSLTLAAIPFIARIVESAMTEIPKGLIEAGLSMGANPIEIIRYFLIPEATPAIVNGLTLTMINLVGYSAMAGAIGGGGLGDLAIRYGYQRFDVHVMLLTIIVLIFLVHIIQSCGDNIAKHFDKR